MRLIVRDPDTDDEVWELSTRQMMMAWIIVWNPVVVAAMGSIFGPLALFLKHELVGYRVDHGFLGRVQHECCYSFGKESGCLRGKDKSGHFKSSCFF